MSIYKSTLNTSKQKEEKKEKVSKPKIKQPQVISIAKYMTIALLILSAVCFICLCTPNNFVKSFLLGAVGISAYPLCLLSIFLCIMGLGKTKYDVNKKYTIFLSCALFFVLMIVHLVLTTKIETNTYSQYLSDTYKLKTSGAGVIMSLFTYFMKKYLTVVGAYIFSVILLTVFIGLILDTVQASKIKQDEKPKKSEFDFGGMITEQKKDEVPVTIKYKQEDLKKKIAKQKLGMESGSSTIISSSMRLDEIPDVPSKYKSKKEYILTPPEIILPDYQKATISNNVSQIKKDPQVVKQDLESKLNLNSDIFVTNTDEFYKDAKVIEGKSVTDENKIQEIKSEKFNTPQVKETQSNNVEWKDASPKYEPQEIKPNNPLFANLNEQKIQPQQFDVNNPNVEQSQRFKKDNNTPMTENNQFKAEKPSWAEAGSNEFQQSIKQVFKDNSINNQEHEYDDEIIEDEYEDVVEDYDNFEQVAEENNFKEYSQSNDIQSDDEDIKLATAHTNEVVRTASINTQPNVFTREVVEEKKEENLLGRPKKHHAEYIKPPTDLLQYIENPDIVTDEECNENIEKLERVLMDFKINAKVKAVQVGPAVTRYEIGMPQGVSVKKVQFHADDIAMALASNGSIRIEAPIPGKNAVGIEVPNRTVMGVSLREMIESEDFKQRVNPMSFVLGKDINGSVQFCNLDKMPHLLVAGSTGSGKSVCLNTMLISMIYKFSPQDLRLILIDPKTVEFSTYAKLPHLLTPDIITTKEHTINALNWAIKEMEYRYGLLQRNQVVNIKEYNALDIVVNNEVEKLPYIVIVIDELGDLMIEAKREMEERIMKLAQKSRAAGIHLVIATQRPSVDVITGTIKANLPSRIAFALTNFADSKTVLDMGGAEKLLGKGDMLFKPNDKPEPNRVQGAFISSREVASVVKFIKENNSAEFDEDAQKDINQTAETTSQNVNGESVSFDPVLKDALRFFIQANQASITLVQRRFGVGYARAARIIDQMEQNGFISPADGSKPRQVLISLEEYNLIFNK